MKKTVLLIMCVIGGFILPSCEKSTPVDEFPIMEQYYTESVALHRVTLDSVKSFSNKVDCYVTLYPKAKQHKRYSKIIENIKAASLRINIAVHEEWDGDTIINL